MIKKLKLVPVISKTKINVVDGTKAYIDLRKKILRDGILEREYGYYILNSIITFAGLFISAYAIYVSSISIFLVFWCLSLAFFTIQMGGLIHDAGHRSIAKSPAINDVLGYTFGSVVGMSYGFWKPYHDKHHAHTNEEGEDPDLDLPLHGFTKKQFLRQKGIWKFLRKYQVLAYFPLRSLVAYSYRLDALRDFKHEKVKKLLWKAPLWIVGMFIWFFLPFFIFPLVKAIVVFLVVHTATGFYMSNIFAPNHKGMPQLAKGTKLSFLEQQIMTSRNIYGHWLTDYVFMGLNYQIEHHLFPNCPRKNLKKITPFVLEICRKMNLEYTQVGIIESNRIILSTLKQVAVSNTKQRV